ncbi:MAG: hypothetical protein HGA45_39020, partial [Chloroflexales bacterium]|nr:hypothetical protein [Chloroflexales bacterium]
MNTINLYRRHIQTLAAEAKATDQRIRAQAHELHRAGDEAGAIHLLASDTALLPMQRTNYLGSMLA